MRPPSPPRAAPGQSAPSTRPASSAASRTPLPETPPNPEKAPTGRAARAVPRRDKALGRRRTPPALPEVRAERPEVAPAPRGWAGAALDRLSNAPGVVSTRLGERLSERQAAQRRLTLRRLAILGGVLAVVALLGYVVLASPLLALRPEHIRVSTTGPSVDPVLVAEVLEPAAGTPLARLSTAALEDSVEGVPGVRFATVRRSWPTGLSVDVIARVPVAAVPSSGGLLLMDVDGVQVGEPVSAAPDGLPVVGVSPGSRGAASLAAVLVVLGDLPPELLGEIREASAESADTVRFRLTDGSRVEWGSSELSALKIRVLEVLRQQPASVYDVSAPSRPVTR